MPDPAYYPTTTIDASPSAIPREGEGKREDLASVARRYQNALNEQGERLLEIHRKLSDREVERIDLRAELAKRDETIAELEAKAAGTEELLEVAEEGRDKATTELALVRDVNGKLDRENTSLAETITSLRTQLARAGAIEVKCPHCGRPTEPINLTCGGCGEWLSKPAASPVVDAAGTPNRNHTHEEFVRWADGQRGTAEGEPKWAPIAVHPDCDGMYLVYSGKDCQGVPVYYIARFEAGPNQEWEPDYLIATHWMPLPAPPEQGERP